MSTILTDPVTPSTYKFERQNFRTGCRIAPKFGTHVPIDTLTLIGYKKLTHPTPGGFRGLLYVVRSFVPSFVRSCHGSAGHFASSTAVLPARPRTCRTTTHGCARPTAHDHARPTAHDHARPRMTDHARTTAHDRARPRTTDRARPRTTTHDHARPRTTTYDHALPRTTTHDLPRTHDCARPRTDAHGRARPRTTTHDRPRTTAHDRPRTTDHGCHICLRKRYPPLPRGV